MNRGVLLPWSRNEPAVWLLFALYDDTAYKKDSPQDILQSE